MVELTREDLLREEALIRAREACCHGQDVNAEQIVAAAEKFYAFLNEK